jgi:hypothetical protein
MLRRETESMGSDLTCNPRSAGDATAVLGQSCIGTEIALCGLLQLVSFCRIPSKGRREQHRGMFEGVMLNRGRPISTASDTS